MADKALSEFVKESLQSGQKRGAITDALLQAGWKQDEIRAALDAYTDVDFPVAVPRPRPYLSAREAFLYLFFFILLGIVSYSLGSLLFGLINQAFPDKDVVNYWQNGAGERQIRSGISGLVVSTPVFLFLASILRKSRRNNPDLQRSRIRKWLTYLSLVVAGCTLVGDMMSVVNSFLSGELTVRFALKAFVIAAIAGSIFTYFLKDAEHGDELDQAK